MKLNKESIFIGGWFSSMYAHTGLSPFSRFSAWNFDNAVMRSVLSGVDSYWSAQLRESVSGSPSLRLRRPRQPRLHSWQAVVRPHGAGGSLARQSGVKRVLGSFYRLVGNNFVRGPGAHLDSLLSSFETNVGNQPRASSTRPSPPQGLDQNRAGQPAVALQLRIQSTSEACISPIENRQWMGGSRGTRRWAER